MPELGVLSDQEIADRVGVSQTTVRRWRKSRGIAVAPPRAASAPPVSPLPYERLLGVETDTVIAQKFGVRVDVVGFERRSRGIARVAVSGPQARRAKDAPRFESSAAPHRVAIATMLRDARIAAGLTHAALAAKLGIVPAHVSLVEYSKRQPSIEVLHTWADACDHDLTLTMTRRGAPPTASPPACSPFNHADLIALADRMLAAGDKDSAAKVLRAAAVALGVNLG